MEYKKNQRIKLRDDLFVGDMYGGLNFSPEGRDFIGEIVTLDKWVTLKNDKMKGLFTIKELKNNHIPLVFSEDMIDHEGSKYILEDGDSLSEAFSKVMNHEKHMANKKKDTDKEADVEEPNQKAIVHPDIAKEQSIQDDILEDFIHEDIAEDLIEEGLIQEDNIRPAHYRKGGDNFDLFEAAYRTRPFKEFRAIMEFVAERYLRRLKGSPEKRIEDLNKAIYTIQRLEEKEVIELKRINDKKEKAKQWISDWATANGLSAEGNEIITLNNHYFNVNDDNLRLSIFNYVHNLTQDNAQRIVPDNFQEYVYNHNNDANGIIRPEVYQDIIRIQFQQ